MYLKEIRKWLGEGRLEAVVDILCVCVVDILLVRGLSEFSGMIRMIYVSF